MGLVDSAIGISVRAGIRVSDGQASKWLARNFARRYSTFQPEFIKQGVVFIRIAMRPAINRDLHDVASRVETTQPQNSQKLLPNIALESLKSRAVELNAAELMLFPSRTSWLAGRFHHGKHDRLLGPFCTFISADADGKIKIHVGVVHAGRV